MYVLIIIYFNLICEVTNEYFNYLNRQWHMQGKICDELLCMLIALSTGMGQPVPFTALIDIVLFSTPTRLQ